MEQVYIITTEADFTDLYAKIHVNDRLYYGQEELYGAGRWVHHIESAQWFADRNQAVEFIFADKFEKTRQFLRGSNSNWQILGLSYEVQPADITPDERRVVVRQNALNRLTDEEREILQLN